MLGLICFLILTKRIFLFVLLLSFLFAGWNQVAASAKKRVNIVSLFKLLFT